MYRPAVGGPETMSDPRGPVPFTGNIVGAVLVLVGVLMSFSVVLWPFGLIAVAAGILSLLRQMRLR